MRRLAPFVLAAALAACGPPKDAQGWARRAADRNRLDEKLEALRELRRLPGDRRAALPALEEVLRQAPRARAEAAVVLGEIGDPAAAPALVAAIEPGSSDRETLEANRAIAGALGILRARAAVPVLQQLAGSPDPFTQVAAVDALGAVGDAAAVDTLVGVATAEGVEPFTRKKALLALGRIGDPRAAPAVLQLLFAEHEGLSFFPEAAFAAALIGRPMAAPLLAVLDGKDESFAAWARQHGLPRGAVAARAAQLLGDVGGAEAVPVLVARLDDRDPDHRLSLLVKVLAAESLGRLRAREAVKPIGELLLRERDPEARVRFADALARIGDPAGLPALRAAAIAGDWEAREGALAGLSRLGGPDDAGVVDAAVKGCGPGCPAERAALLEGMRARLAAAGSCAAAGATGAACWAAKLEDRQAAVRDRAALEVGRAGGPQHAAALAAAATRPVADEADLVARYHALLGLEWRLAAGPLPDAGAIAAGLEKAIAADRGRVLTAGVNEEAVRLAARLERGVPAGAAAR